jgi:thymidylate synthase
MDAQGFDYTYGQRLGFQIKDIIERLQKVPQSRRLAYVILEPHDLDRDLAMPCLISGVFANVKGTLNHVAYYRSWDVVGGMPANLEALQGLTEKVAHETKKTPGWLNVVAMNAHIRGDDFDKL